MITNKRYGTTAGLLVWALAGLAGQADAADKLITIDTRPGVTLPYWYMPRSDAMATIVLLPGGAGGIGLRNSVPVSKNFLVRSRDLFARHGFNVAIVGRPSDKQDLTLAFRTTPEHIQDLRAIVIHLAKQSRAPIWLVGTSRGTVSATAAAIDFGTGNLGGIVLTASITRGTDAVPTQRLRDIRIPVLVVHHERDGCPLTRRDDIGFILRELTNAPVKKQVIVRGGNGAKGNPCEALHWHGFIGAEKETADVIAAWIKQTIP